MPADSLTAALVGNSGAETNPFLLQYQPEIQLAQGMMGQGFSTAPASPAQALARALTGAIGAGIQKSTTSELAKTIGDAAHRASGLFKPGTIMHNLLSSPDPAQQMVGWNALPKATLQLNQPEKLEPPQIVGQAGTDVPLTTGSAHQGYKAAQAGAAATAPYQFENTVVNTPQGPVERPVSKAALAANEGAPAPRSTGLGSGPATAAPQPQPQQAPQQQAAPTFGKTPMYQGAVTANEDAAKSFAGKETENFTAAQNLQQRLTLMDHNIEALGPNWMGAGANAKAEAGKAWNSVLDSFNVQGFHIDPTKIATWEDFNKETKRAGMELIKSNFGGSREAASIIQMGNTAVSSVENTYLGAKYVNSTIRAGAQAVSDLYNYKKQLYNSGQSLVGAEADFFKQHTPESYAMGAITSQIPAPAVAHLRANPALAPHFDKQFGANTAEFLLGPRQ